MNQDLARYHQSRARQIATKDANLQLIATKSQANRQQMQSELALGQWEMQSVQNKMRWDLQEKYKYKTRCQEAIKNSLQEAMRWKQFKKQEDTINELNFDRNYISEIQTDNLNTYLDFFYEKKVNKSFNNYADK